jgi:hypothetical protein
VDLERATQAPLCVGMPALLKVQPAELAQPITRFQMIPPEGPLVKIEGFFEKMQRFLRAALFVAHPRELAGPTRRRLRVGCVERQGLFNCIRSGRIVITAMIDFRKQFQASAVKRGLVGGFAHDASYATFSVVQLSLRELRMDELELKLIPCGEWVPVLLGFGNCQDQMLLGLRVVVVKEVALAFQAIEVAVAMPSLNMLRGPGREPRGKPEEPENRHVLITIGISAGKLRDVRLAPQE